MPRPTADSEAWKRIVLQAMPLPAWLSEDGPKRDIVLSTRVRFMRNLRGHRFAHAADPSELKEIGDKALSAFSETAFEVLRNVSPAERDYLVACRLASPDFDWRAPGRALVVDSARSLSVMINEEDHLRIQSLTPGWSFPAALEQGETLLNIAQRQLEFAQTDDFGYLAASVPNSGEGRRYSAMFHLIGLAHGRRLATVIRALNAQGMVVRGLFGERSRAIGAFLQVSTTATSVPYFVGACEYLLDEETRARFAADPSAILEKTRDAAHFVETSKGITLADALRVLAWIRWTSCLSSSSRSVTSPQAQTSTSVTSPLAQTSAQSSTSVTSPLTLGEKSVSGANRMRGLATLSSKDVDACIPELALLESLDEPRAGRSRLEVLRRVYSH